MPEKKAEGKAEEEKAAPTVEAQAAKASGQLEEAEQTEESGAVRIREYRSEPSKGFGDGPTNETRIRELEDGEEMPKDAYEVPADTPLTSWKRA
jgi:hypothetical protein